MERMIVRLVVGAVVVVVLIIGADRAAAIFAARSVAQGLAQAQGIARPPDVTFRGVPFLTQVVQGRFGRVDVAARDVPTEGELVVDRLDARLYGVRADALQALRGESAVLLVDRGEADVFTSFAALQRAADAWLADRGARLTFGQASDDRVTFTARVDAIVGTVTIQGQALVAVQRDTVVVKLLPETLTGVPPALRSWVTTQVDLSPLVPALPFGFRVTDVEVGPDGLRSRASGTALRMPV